MLYELDGGPASDPGFVYEFDFELEIELEGSGLGSFRWSRRDEGKVRDVNCPLANDHRDLQRDNANSKSFSHKIPAGITNSLISQRPNGSA
jgi:hypothetical protein